MEVVVPSVAVVAALIAIALLIRRAGSPAPSDRRPRHVLARGLATIARLLRRISIDQWRAIDAETAREPGEPGTTSLTVLMVLVTVAASLTLQEYVGGHDIYGQLFPPDGSRYWELRGYVWWAVWRVFGYVVLPMAVLACLPGQRIADYYVSLRGFLRHLWIYALLFFLISPAVLYTSTLPSFRQTYPFYALANRSYLDLAIWELLYAVQFLALEFFFRGFLLHGLRRALGANAIFVMLVPYCMIHFRKPMPETLGAIGAGLILGTLAMRTRSIWGGVVIHVGVATVMDVLALRGCPPFGGGPCR
jgi:membrane protease YdiL (CAAX protease family)